MGSYWTVDDKGKVEIHASGKMPAGTKFTVGPTIHIAPEPEAVKAPMEVRAAKLFGACACGHDKKLHVDSAKHCVGERGKCPCKEYSGGSENG